MKWISKILIVLAVEIILKSVNCGILGEPELDNKSENSTNNIQKQIITEITGYSAQNHARVIKNNITKNKTALQATATNNSSGQSVHSEAYAKTPRIIQDQTRRTKRLRKQTQVDQNSMIARSSSLKQYKPRNTSKQKHKNENYEEEALWSQYLLLGP